MTNKEAIRILERMLDEFCNEDSYAPKCKDAVDMAIEALKGQPEHRQNTMQKQPDLNTFGMKTGETCEDVIRRQDAIDALKEYEKRVETAEQLWTIRGCKDEILKLPFAEPERKKGKWIIKKDEKTDMTYGECSSCSMKNYAGRTNFCPNCGADMRGEAYGD